MPRLAYERKRFSADTLAAIVQANAILEEYDKQGFDLTLRQLFYQHVARGLIPNTEKSYKRLGNIVNDARMAGYIDWHHIVDRTRNLRSIGHWDDPSEIIEATINNYRRDLWASQDNYVECWIEKDALVGVIQQICNRLDMPYFSCRGYTSQSEMWGASQRLLKKIIAGKSVTILHLGDHDPSGIDMTRDIRDRLRTFISMDYLRHSAKEAGMKIADMSEVNISATLQEVRGRIQINRIALTMDQIDQYDPPPNPAKLSDTRAGAYIRDYGDQSWELDALEPSVLAALIQESADELIEDSDAWDAAIEKQEEGQKLLREASTRWDELVETLNGDDDG